MEKKYRFVDLFSGIGAFHQAFSGDKYECVMASDIDAHCRKTYFDNYGIMPEGNIKEIEAVNVPDHDILTAGFPCQPFSISGIQKGFEDNRGDLFFDVIRIAKVKKPKLILLENVKNLVGHDNGHTLDVMLDELRNLGYIVNYKVLSAIDFGLPQKRERLFIVASTKEFAFTDKKYEKKYLKDIVDYSVSGLPNEKLVNLQYNEKSKVNSISDKPLKIGQIKKGGQGDRIYSVNGPAITLSASSGGTGSKTGLYQVGENIRKLTLDECKAVQGFPQKFKCTSSDTQSYKQFGNSIPVNVIKYLVECIEEQGLLKE